MAYATAVHTTRGAIIVRFVGTPPAPTRSTIAMASQRTLVIIAALAALVLLCESVRASPAPETEVLHRAKRFSIEGIVTCFAMLGLAGSAEVYNEITEHCDPLLAANHLTRYRMCVFGKIAHLGPEYLQCVFES
ncbi:UDP-N-acetylglucosamine--N-acetylmuramyl-(pentapeptide) pyrophosphoryl-undecaprenol N-acetylglucosamine transferase [Frankliniella fusca]|uniref:UDP-N-acetylglucosamine--N-acetylmuramyl-(Pentapeptide) pyrophosphoryl-undecaprenol N-acetylglucosamine transferase n=1 Tax=Frankliniella fusca TaxID=407009 RepID=A0AAE1HIM6_9NEOP|nr:UDP-N-acetylglucosamine--N-acetylmuramyl-(pentapeptide) pyrophosphoryl-undecaprenol N-acetylglucosamine transferase [Frankliniella fusca]